MPLSQNGECSSGNAPTCLAAGPGFESPCVRYFLAKKGRRKDAGPPGPCGPRCPTCSPPRPQAETRWWDRIATSLRLGPNGGTTSPRPRGGTCWWDHGATSSRWYTSQTIYDDLVLLFYDDSFVFVIILRAKAPSLVTYDKAGNFVIESACSVMKFVSVTAESSLMNTFLVVRRHAKTWSKQGLSSGLAQALH